MKINLKKIKNLLELTKKLASVNLKGLSLPGFDEIQIPCGQKFSKETLRKIRSGIKFGFYKSALCRRK